MDRKVRKAGALSLRRFADAKRSAGSCCGPLATPALACTEFAMFSPWTDLNIVHFWPKYNRRLQVECTATLMESNAAPISILGSVPYPVPAEERLPPTLQKAGGQSIPVMALGAEDMLILAWPIKEGIINAARVRRPASCRFTARLSRARERAEGKRCG